MNIGVHTLPEIKKDVTDRNRTSPFAFTGNKFEFRTVASSLSIAGPNTVLNTIVADALSDFADELEKVAPENMEKKMMELIQQTLKEHQRVIFNGDGYSEEWVAEAAKRGLPNEKSFVGANSAMTDPKTIEVFAKHGVLSRLELESRAEINYETYAKTINIEAKTMLDMASRQFIPAVIKYTTELADSINSVRAANPQANISVQTSRLTEVSKLLAEAEQARIALEGTLAQALSVKDMKGKAEAFYNRVFPAMEALRAPIDALEGMVDKDLWPVPNYADLLFEV